MSNPLPYANLMADELLEIKSWIEQHSHGDLFTELDELREMYAVLPPRMAKLEQRLNELPCGQCDEGERLEALEEGLKTLWGMHLDCYDSMVLLKRQCKQYYLESKGEGP